MIEHSGPSLPLSREAFRHALQVGHGRARMHVDAFGASDFRDEILEAATVCKVYDPQVEELPTIWLADLCEDADIICEIVDRQPQGAYYDRELRCALLKEFVVRGHSAARQALYDACQDSEYGGELHGSDEIIEIDGAQGLLFVARKLGTLASVDETIKAITISTRSLLGMGYWGRNAEPDELEPI